MMPMMNMTFDLPAEYWQNLVVDRQDIEFLQNHLFETETPLSSIEMAAALVKERIRREGADAKSKRDSYGRVFAPRDHYQAGDRLVFPALNWKPGSVLSVRDGNNPQQPPFEVITVSLEDGSQRLFAASLEEHALNNPPELEESQNINPEAIIESFGEDLADRIEQALENDESLVRIAERWFPGALLVDINMGHLNLAEAILDVSGGEPMPTEALIKELDLAGGVNPRLVEFSLNYALQGDKRFDEVGPAGQVLWVLERHEPEDVRTVPAYLRYFETGYDTSQFGEQMRRLEIELDDELSRVEVEELPSGEQATICLTYPHWRAGTLPVSRRLLDFFPTAYESERVRFTLRDTNTREALPAWVVRKSRYVYGLRNWYIKNGLIPGGYITLRKSKTPGEVLIEPRTHRPTREWVRTVLAGTDGGLVYAVLKQEVACEYNERMVIAVPDLAAVDSAWAQAAKSRQTLEQLAATNVRELSKLTPQGHVHAQELYSALNILRRCPPGPLFSILSTSRQFRHVGDLYFRLADADSDEE